MFQQHSYKPISLPLVQTKANYTDTLHSQKNNCIKDL